MLHPPTGKCPAGTEGGLQSGPNHGQMRPGEASTARFHFQCGHCVTTCRSTAAAPCRKFGIKWAVRGLSKASLSRRALQTSTWCAHFTGHLIRCCDTSNRAFDPGMPNGSWTAPGCRSAGQIKVAFVRRSVGGLASPLIAPCRSRQRHQTLRAFCKPFSGACRVSGHTHPVWFWLHRQLCLDIDRVITSFVGIDQDRLTLLIGQACRKGNK